ncbi:MAG: hypothetical protein U0791_16960 [Gemmataceae bacterium]
MDLRAFVFVPALVACVLFGAAFALFLANHYMNVLQSTGSGAREVSWPSEPFVDNAWKVLYLGWLIGLWLGPAWFLGQAFAKTDVPWMRYAVPLSVFWLLYPFSQLSSLSGPSVWLPVHHDVFGRLARKPHIVLGFLFFSGLTLAVFGLGFHWAFIQEGFVFLLAGAPLFVIAALVYARLLGRLAFSLMFTKSILARKKRKKKPAEESREAASSAPPAVPEFQQPSELPPIRTPDEGDLTGYDIRVDEKPKKRIRAQSLARPEPEMPPSRPKFVDDEDTQAYGVRAPEVEPEDRAPVDIVKPSALEMKLLGRDDAPKPPKQVWTPQLLAFLGQVDTLAVLGLLTFLCILFGAVVRVAREFNPVRGATD